MIFQRARHSAYTDDDPPIVLALRYATEPPAKPWGSFLIAWAMHSVWIGAVLLDSHALTEMPKPQPRRVTRLFVPAARIASRREPGPPEKKANAALKASRPKLEDPVDVPSPKGRVDMNSIEISVVDDTSDQLPEVIRQQQGILALVERDDQAIAHYVFEPPDWKMSDRIVDVSGRIRFSMSPPSRWALLRTLADRHSIEIEKYQVDALFDSAYARCLEEEIRKRAEKKPDAGRVRAAVLIFTSSRSCGVDVVNLEFANR